MTRPVPVPTPVLNKVPIVRRIPVPVASEKNRGTKILNSTNVHVHMPESEESSESSESEEIDLGHSHYQNGYSWNDRNKWGGYGCNMPGCGFGHSHGG